MHPGSTISYIPELRKEVKDPRKYNLMHPGNTISCIPELRKEVKPPEVQSHAFRNCSKKLRIFGSTNCTISGPAWSVYYQNIRIGRLGLDSH
jgi:hypothetical protein